MRPPANANGGDTKPLAAMIKPMKKIFFDMDIVSLRYSPVSKQKYSWHISASYGLFQLWTYGSCQRSLRAGTSDEKPAELIRQALRLRTLDIRDQELSLDLESFDYNDLEVCA